MGGDPALACLYVHCLRRLSVDTPLLGVLLASWVGARLWFSDVAVCVLSSQEKPVCEDLICCLSGYMNMYISLHVYTS